MADKRPTSRLPSDVVDDSCISGPLDFRHGQITDIFAAFGQLQRTSDVVTAFGRMHLVPRKEDADFGAFSSQGHHILTDNRPSSENIKSSAEDEAAAICDHDKQILNWFEQNADGDTFLHLCIIHGKHQESIYLIENSQQNPSLLDMQNNMQQTPLILAAWTKQTGIVRHLISAGADVNICDHRGNTPLHIACNNGDLETLDALTRAHWTRWTLDVKNFEGYSPLHLATLGGHREMLSVLDIMGSSINEREAKSGKTALHLAIEKGDTRTIEHLVYECHANVNIPTFYDPHLSPLILAEERNQKNIQRYLIEHGAGNIQNITSDIGS